MRSGCGRPRARRRGAARVATAALAGAAGFLTSGLRLAFAADANDTSYGRIDGDVALVVGAGATVADRGPRGEAELRVRYLDTAGGVFPAQGAGPLRWGAAPRRRLPPPPARGAACSFPRRRPHRAS